MVVIRKTTIFERTRSSRNLFSSSPVRETSTLEKERVSRNLFSSSPIAPSSGPDSSNLQRANSNLSNLLPEGFIVKQNQRPYELPVASKRNSMLLTTASLKKASSNLDQLTQCTKPVYFLGPKVPSNTADSNEFAAPKLYVCQCRNKIFLSVFAYVKHLRKHKLSIRCSGCDRTFKDIVKKRRHELRCPKKHKLRL